MKIADISKDLGLSISTVSKALNGYPDVSDATRELVMQRARELGYQASASARNLRRGRTDKIGLLINHSIIYISEYLTEIVAGAGYVAEQNGKNITLYMETVHHPEGIERICRSREIDGALLLWANPNRDTLRIFEEEKMPYILLGRRVDYANASFVAPDNEEGAYQLIRHLIELGHTRIGIMTRPVHGPTNTDRVAGYMRALRETNLPFDEDIMIPTALEQDSGYYAMLQLLDLPDPPTAVFAFYDLLAVDALRAASERGLRVPEDVAIAGFDGLQSSLMTYPAITTVKQPLQEMGRQAVELLLECIEDDTLPAHKVTFPVELLVRGSTVGRILR
ncbi:MAG: LacI family DNA-binding transcriptional regulator [Anaerolineaceae bacterium]|nr:LacI family DNA-binding transcriptional regulator [Anaerolineaceae bacterium]